MVVGYGLLQLGRRVSLYPIETIVTFFVLTTLAYFHVLSAIKHSQFLTPTHSPSSAPIFATYSDSKPWSITHNTRSSPAVEIVQLQLSIPGEYPALQSQITDELNNQKPYSSVCYNHNNSCLSSIRPETYTFAFDPKANSAAAFASAFAEKQLNVEQDGTSFNLVKQHQSIAEIQSGKWLAYAGRALVLRFWSLAKVRTFLFASPFNSRYLVTDNSCPPTHVHIYNILECRLCGHCCRSPWLSPDACHLCQTLPFVPQVGLQFLARLFRPRDQHIWLHSRPSDRKLPSNDG